MEPKKVISFDQLSEKERDIIANIRVIEAKEVEMASAIGDVISHVAGTYEDKYAKGQEFGIDTKEMLYNPEKGDLLNIYQTSRYLQRYITEGCAKSHLLIDMKKAIHYLLFEIVRRKRIGDAESLEPKI